MDDRCKTDLAVRRDVLAALGGLCISAWWPRGLAAQNASSTLIGKIDVHHHFQAPGSVGLNAWSPTIAIEEMDRNGVATGVGYVQAPPALTALNDVESVRKQTREWNDFGAKVVSDHPDRFGLLRCRLVMWRAALKRSIMQRAH